MNIIITEPGNITMAKLLNGDWNILNSAGGFEYSGDLASITSIELSSNQRLVMPTEAIPSITSASISGAGDIHVTGVTATALDLSTLNLSTTGDRTASLGRMENHYEVSRLGYSMDMSGDAYQDVFISNLISGGAETTELAQASAEYRTTIENFLAEAASAIEESFSSYVTISNTNDTDPNRLPMDQILGVPELASQYLRIDTYDTLSTFEQTVFSNTVNPDAVANNLMFFGFSIQPSADIDAVIDEAINAYQSGSGTVPEKLGPSFDQGVYFEDQALAHLVGTQWVDDINLEGFVLDLEIEDSLTLSIEQADGLAINRIFPDNYDWNNAEVRGEIYISGFDASSDADLSNIATYMTLDIGAQNVDFNGAFHSGSNVDIHGVGEFDISSLNLNEIPSSFWVDNGATLIISAEQSDFLDNSRIENNGTVRIIGTDGSDTIIVNDGNYEMLGGAGGDILHGGSGNDTVFGHIW